MSHRSRAGGTVIFLALGALIAAGVLAGCGSSDSGDAQPPPKEYLLTGEQIDALSEESANPGPVRASLEFWQALQFQDYPAAYAYLSEPLQRRIPYEEFLEKIGLARGFFLAQPEVYDVATRGQLVTVYLIAKQGEDATRSDQLFGLAFNEVDGQWRLTSDLLNVFHEQVQAVPGA
jgi:hypothetical protein